MEVGKIRSKAEKKIFVKHISGKEKILTYEWRVYSPISKIYDITQ